jgi:hypothetical protein
MGQGHSLGLAYTRMGEDGLQRSRISRINFGRLRAWERLAESKGIGLEDLCLASPSPKTSAIRSPQDGVQPEAHGKTCVGSVQGPVRAPASRQDIPTGILHGSSRSHSRSRSRTGRVGGHVRP